MGCKGGIANGICRSCRSSWLDSSSSCDMCVGAGLLLLFDSNGVDKDILPPNGLDDTCFSFLSSQSVPSLDPSLTACPLTLTMVDLSMLKRFLKDTWSLLSSFDSIGETGGGGGVNLGPAKLFGDDDLEYDGKRNLGVGWWLEISSAFNGSLSFEITLKALFGAPCSCSAEISCAVFLSFATKMEGVDIEDEELSVLNEDSSILYFE